VDLTPLDKGGVPDGVLRPLAELHEDDGAAIVGLKTKRTTTMSPSRMLRSRRGRSMWTPVAGLRLINCRLIHRA